MGRCRLPLKYETQLSTAAEIVEEATNAILLVASTRALEALRSEAARLHHACWRRGCSVAAYSTRAAIPESASYWLPGTPTSFAPRTQAFVEGLRDLGYVEGRTVAIEWKWGEDRVDRLPDLAAELVGSQVDVIVTGGTPATKAVKNVTHTIPVIMAMSVIRSAPGSSRVLADRAGMPPGSA
jgi:ABC transporter substrate binding protein